MSVQPDKVDEVIRDWYERQAMSGARVTSIRRAVIAMPMWQTRVVVACVLIALVAMLTITFVLLLGHWGAPLTAGA